VAPGFWSSFLVAVLLVSLVAGAAYLVVRSTPDPSSAGLSPTAYAYPTIPRWCTEQASPAPAATPDTYPLNKNTALNAGINVVSGGMTPSPANPFGTDIIIFQPTIERVIRYPDGCTLLTVGLPGGPLVALDQHRSDPNFLGSPTEEVIYSWNSTGDSNNHIDIMVVKGPYVSQGDNRQEVDFTAGTSQWNFYIWEQFNPAFLGALRQSVGGRLRGVPTLICTFLTPSTPG
jgi:hypothetical protein